MTHVDFPYPTAAQAGDAVATLLGKLGGDDVPLDCLVHCTWVASGYAASLALPHAAEAVATCPSSLANDLVGLANAASPAGTAVQAGPVGAIDWLSVAMLIIELIKKWRS